MKNLFKLFVCSLVLGVVALASCGPEVHEHTLEKHDAKTATCTEAGNSAYYSCECGKYFSDEQGTTEIEANSWVVAAAGHQLTKTDAVAATCTEAGNTAYWQCSACNKYFSDANGTTVVTEGSWVVAATGHQLTKTDAVAATCTTTGNTEYYTCTCGKYFSDANAQNEVQANSWVLASLGHSMTETAAVAATCTVAGNVKYYTCSTCNKTYADEAGTQELQAEELVVAALGHTMQNTAAVAATCTTAGNTAYSYCTVCEKYFNNEQGETEIEENSWVLAALGHSMTKTDAVAETCTTPGNTEYYTCSTCNHFFADANGETSVLEGTWYIEPKGHTLNHTEAADATFTATGNLEYWHCATCSVYFKDELAANAYTENEWVTPKRTTINFDKEGDVNLITAGTRNGLGQFAICTTDSADGDGKCLTGITPNTTINAVFNKDYLDAMFADPNVTGIYFAIKKNTADNYMAYKTSAGVATAYEKGGSSASPIMELNIQTYWKGYVYPRSAYDTNNANTSYFIWATCAEGDTVYIDYIHPVYDTVQYGFENNFLRQDGNNILVYMNGTSSFDLGVTSGSGEKCVLETEIVSEGIYSARAKKIKDSEVGIQSAYFYNVMTDTQYVAVDVYSTVAFNTAATVFFSTWGDYVNQGILLANTWKTLYIPKSHMGSNGSMLRFTGSPDGYVYFDNIRIVDSIPE